MSPPPKMETPDSGYPNKLVFKEEIDENKYLEVDATPPAAVKKSRKRTNSKSSSSVDPEVNSISFKILTLNKSMPIFLMIGTPE